LRRFALKCFFALHIESFYNLKIFGATFGVWGGIAPIAPPGYGPGLWSEGSVRGIWWCE